IARARRNEGLTLSDALIGAKEKDLIFLDRAAESGAKDVAQKEVRLRLSLRLRKVIQRVKRAGIAMILKHAAVKFVSAALGHDVDDRALIATIFRRVYVSDDVYFVV